MAQNPKQKGFQLPVVSLPKLKSTARERSRRLNCRLLGNQNLGQRQQNISAALQNF